MLGRLGTVTAGMPTNLFRLAYGSCVPTGR
jgi:hypothetical protein